MKNMMFAAACLMLASTNASAFAIPPCGGATVEAEDVFFHPGSDAKPAPLELAFAKSLLENEANGGRVAYCLSDARMSSGKNGLSFGFFQYDLKQNPAATLILVDILESVVDIPDANISKADVRNIKAGALSQKAPELRASTSQSKRRLIERVNSALATELGVAEINAYFVSGMQSTIKNNDQRVSMLTDKVGARTLLQNNNTARLILLDYENFFGAFGNQFRGFLNGEPQNLKAGTISIGAPAATTDIINFYLSGKQGSGPANDERAECLRRINNVVRYAQEIDGPIALTDRDKSYLMQTLKPILDDTGNPYIVKKRAGHQYDALLTLLERAT
ncbi:hypothetical protein [Neorhizobium sp. P12A]|uniref:hypothetical protein n=1 Tax=Neorhizobium sp. P12A TaxID=2268027 RepID=UPI0011EBBB77|nr:hypothetical protein [Neorhizobium sp. P12A]